MNVDNLKKALGKEISRLRKEQGFSSQESFADAVGLHRTYIGAIERGERNVSIENLCAIAAALKISLSSLIIQAEAMDR